MSVTPIGGTPNPLAVQQPAATQTQSPSAPSAASSAAQSWKSALLAALGDTSASTAVTSDPLIAALSGTGSPSTNPLTGATAPATDPLALLAGGSPSTIAPLQTSLSDGSATATPPLSSTDPSLADLGLNAFT
jgi:hypothetical protein